MENITELELIICIEDQAWYGIQKMRDSWQQQTTYGDQRMTILVEARLQYTDAWRILTKWQGNSDRRMAYARHQQRTTSWGSTWGGTIQELFLVTILKSCKWISIVRGINRLVAKRDLVWLNNLLPNKLYLILKKKKVIPLLYCFF